MNYPLVASKAMMKVKAYWPSASTDEPQVLALAELLKDGKFSQETDIILGVTALAKTEAGKRNDFRPTPAMIYDAAQTVRRDRYQRERSRVPQGMNPDGTWYDTETGRLAEETDPDTGQVKTKIVASPETRELAVARIRAYLGGDADAIVGQFRTPEATPDLGDDRTTFREDIGGYALTIPHITGLATESRKAGVPDTEDEIIQHRWTFDPPPRWRMQPTCGPWVNSQLQAMNDGKTWLIAANRRYA